MSNLSGLEIFERAVEAGGRILRAEADYTDAAPGMLLLTFDVGRIAIRPHDDGLVIEPLEVGDAPPAGLEVLDENEPWWRLLGQPITAAWPGGLKRVSVRSGCAR